MSLNTSAPAALSAAAVSPAAAAVSYLFSLAL
jgi:hypothetical protein